MTCFGELLDRGLERGPMSTRRWGAKVLHRCSTLFQHVDALEELDLGRGQDLSQLRTDLDVEASCTNDIFMGFGHA